MPSRAGAEVLGVAHTRPGFAVPANSCDCHVHVFGQPERYPLAGDRLYTPGAASLDDLLAHQAALGLERAVIVQPSPYGADNACTLDALRLLGPRGRGVAVIDQATTDEALALMHEAGIRGVRVNLETGGIDDIAVAGAALRRAAERVAPLGWHVQAYTNVGVVAALHDAIVDLPTILVLDHFGRAKAALGPEQPDLAPLLSLLARGKVYVKISAPHRISDMPDYADAAAIARAMIAANPERILWGSDWPHTGVHRGPVDAVEPFRAEDDGRALNRLHDWARDAEELKLILVENPSRLYGFE